MLYSRELNYVEINQFVAVTDDLEFCLGTTLLYIDTRSTSLFTLAHRSLFTCWIRIHGHRTDIQLLILSRYTDVHISTPDTRGAIE